MTTTLRDAISVKYPKNATTIAEKWTIATGTPFDWQSITKPNLSQFADWLCENMARTSAKTYCAQLKAVINVYCDDGSLPRGWEKMLSVKGDASEQVYLTDGELRRVIDYSPDTPTEAIVQQQFVLSAIVGARHGDIVRLTESNIRDGFLCYVSEKTHIKAQVPLAATVRRILTGDYRHRADEDFELYAYRGEVSDVTFNATIRRICELCDIDEVVTLYRRGKTVTAPKWQFVASHTGRRTCATLLYLHDCDIYTISRILAHSSVEMTAQKYIMSPIRELSASTMQFFNQYK